MFRPNQTGKLSTATGYDRFGQPLRSDPVNVAFAPVQTAVLAARTSVRADSSASRGSSDELTSKAKILVAKTATIKIGDRFETGGLSFVVVGVHARHSVLGRLDHFECDLELLP